MNAPPLGPRQAYGMPIIVFCHVCNQGYYNNNCIKAVFMLIKKVEKEIVVFVKYFQTIVLSMAIKSYNKLKLLYLVTMATTKNI